MNKLKTVVLVSVWRRGATSPAMPRQAGRRGATTAAAPTTRATSRLDCESTARTSTSFASHGPTRPKTNISYVFNPIIVDNMMYMLARNNSLVAINATTGGDLGPRGPAGHRAPRYQLLGSKDRSDRRLLFQLNSYLQAIDARTGKSILTFGKNGAVNLREGLRRDPATMVKRRRPTPERSSRTSSSLDQAAGENYMAPPVMFAPSTS